MKPSKDELLQEITRLRKQLENQEEQNRQLLQQLNKVLEDTDDRI